MEPLPARDRESRIGVLLAQLGTPDAPTTPAVRRYLRQFLSDSRVVEANRVWWWFILNFIVLPRRPRRSAALYRKIWSREGSPLLVTSRSQAHALETELNRHEPGRFKVALGMRYGNPSIASALRELVDSGVDRLLLFPMYPQYAGASTGSACDEVFEQLSKLRFVPALRVVPPYYDHPAYIDALAELISEGVARVETAPEIVVISFHGIPRRSVDRGDPYAAHCDATARALAARMGWGPDAYVVSYQSRFGREPWLQLYTDEVLVRLARTGVRRLMVVCPGFVADCLETIEEIGGLGLQQFRAAGGELLHLVPCLNDRPSWIAAMTRIVLQQLRGWA